MSQRYADAMAVVASHGKPDLFVTMTCNPKWDEIQQSLPPGRKAHHCPWICARVFHLKFK